MIKISFGNKCVNPIVYFIEREVDNFRSEKKNNMCGLGTLRVYTTIIFDKMGYIPSRPIYNSDITIVRARIKVNLH